MKDLKNKFLKNYNKNILNKIIIILIGVFLVSLILPSNIIHYFLLPLNFSEFITQPWTLITTIFFHKDFMHLLFNLLYLWFLGKIFISYIHNKLDFIRVFFIGGILASITTLIIQGVILNQVGVALGASGAIMSIVFAALYITPEKYISLFGVFNLKMKWIAWLLFSINIFGIDSNGGAIAHLTGAIYGYIWIKKYYRRDILKDIINFN